MWNRKVRYSRLNMEKKVTQNTMEWSQNNWRGILLESEKG